MKIADVRSHFLGIQPDDIKPAGLEDVRQGIAIYARTSTDHQRDYLAGQIQRLEQYAKAHFAGQPVRVFSEVGSGANSDRPQFNRLIDAMLSGEISTLLIEVRDRLSRTSYGIVERLAERCGVRIIITEPENDPKDGTSELMADIQSLFVLYNARQNGKRAGKRTMFVAPPGLRERVAALHGAGTSYRAMIRQLPTEGWKCANTGKTLSAHMVRLCLKEVLAGLREKRGSEEVVPSHVRQFVARCCTTGPAKNVYALPVMRTYALFCERAGVPALNHKGLSRAVKAMGFKYARQSTGRYRVLGLALRGNEHASRNFRAPVALP